MAEYLEALRLNPQLIQAHNNLGTLLVKLGRFDEALKHYHADLTQWDPDDWHAPYLMGKALLKQDRDAEAIPYFRNAMPLDPDNLPMLVFLAQVLASDENPKVAAMAGDCVRAGVKSQRPDRCATSPSCSTRWRWPTPKSDISTTRKTPRRTR